MADQMATGNDKEPEEQAPKKGAPLTLETLPRKIISMILATMTIDVNEPYVVSRSTFQTLASRTEEDARARRDLTSLCMVSRRMVSKARRALYRNILIDDADTLVLLYRTFLEKPQFGIFVKRMSLNICHGQKGYVNSTSGRKVCRVDLGPLPSYAYHGFPECLEVERGRDATEIYNITIERLYTLQFRVLSCTKRLRSLDINVHHEPELTNGNTLRYNKEYSEAVTYVLSSLWKETSSCLSRLSELQLIGKEEGCAFWNRRGRSAARICRSFLTLPKLEQLVWLNHSHHWFDAFSRRMVSGPIEQLRADTASIRILQLAESPCLPHDLATLCSALPNLESLSVDTDSDQCRCRLKRLQRRPLELHAEGDPNSGLVVKYLTDSLATLANLTTLNLDLHYACDISRSLGPSGTLSLAGLPNLQTLAVPFHFFIKRGPGGYHKVVSPTSVLPRTLKTLRIVACFWCIGYRVYKTPRIVVCSCGSFRIRGYASDRALSKYQHPVAVLKFLEDIANLRAEFFPNLTNIYYEEGKPDPTHEHITWKCQHPPTEILMHSNRDTRDALRLTAVSESLRQSGVALKMRATKFECEWLRRDLDRYR